MNLMFVKSVDLLVKKSVPSFQWNHGSNIRQFHAQTFPFDSDNLESPQKPNRPATLTYHSF